MYLKQGIFKKKYLYIALKNKSQNCLIKFKIKIFSETKSNLKNLKFTVYFYFSKT